MFRNSRTSSRQRPAGNSHENLETKRPRSHHEAEAAVTNLKGNVETTNNNRFIPKSGRGSLAARDANGYICQTGSVQFQLGEKFSNRAHRQKVHGTVVICTFCRSAQNRPNGQFRPHMAQHRPHCGSLSASEAATLA